MSTPGNRGVDQPVGVILAGGAGRRIGGSKATVRLQGRPLICYPLGALSAVLEDVAVLAKPDTELPSLPGVTVWVETEILRHPLVGIRQALGLAGGLAVVVCAADLPFVSPEVVRQIAFADPHGAPAVVACSGGAMQPLLGCYQPRALGQLGSPSAAVSLGSAVEAIEPRLLEVEDPDVLFNVNSPDDLLQAAAMLDRRRVG